MTDGEGHDVDTETMAAAKTATEAGVIIFTLGVGTPAGEVLQVRDDKGNMEFVKDEQGNAVQSRLNQTLLRQIATTAKGFYLPLMGADPMKTLYDRGLVAAAQDDSHHKADARSPGAVPLAAGPGAPVPGGGVCPAGGGGRAQTENVRGGGAVILIIVKFGPSVARLRLQ